jgi:hypothetical protein
MGSTPESRADDVGRGNDDRCVVDLDVGAALNNEVLLLAKCTDEGCQRVFREHIAHRVVAHRDGESEAGDVVVVDRVSAWSFRSGGAALRVITDTKQIVRRSGSADHHVLGDSVARAASTTDEDTEIHRADGIVLDVAAPWGRRWERVRHR